MRAGIRTQVTCALFAALLLAGAGYAPEAPLADAARRGDAAAVKALLAQGADVNVAQGDGMTALHWAAERGDVEIARALLTARADVKAGTRIGRYTPLHLASKGGHTEVATLLIQAGSDVNVRTSNTGSTPLHLAAGAAAGEGVVAALLQNGAQVDAREGAAGQTPLMFAAGRNRAAAVRVLLKAGADPELTTEVVDVLRRVAADREAGDRFKQVIAEFKKAENGGADWQPTPAQVQAAVRAQRELLQRSGQLVADADALATSTQVLQLGAQEQRRQLPIREVLVSKEGGMTALLHATREGNLEAAVALLDGGADVNQASAGDHTSPLLMAALNGHYDLALVLLERGGDPTVAAATDGATPLFSLLQTHYAPKTSYPQPRAHERQKAEHYELMKALLDAGADPNAALVTHLWYWEYGFSRIGIDIKGATPFWRAAFAQDLPAMKMLVAYGADPDVPTTLPEVGMRENRQQDGRLQEDSGLPPAPEGSPNAYPIHAAAGGGYLGLGAFAIRNVPGNFMPAVKYLVEELGADVNARDAWGYAPLHYAASRGDNEMIEYLVEKGADVKAKTRLGQTTADMARGGRAGYFQRVALPETQKLLESLGSELACLNVHFKGTGDVCEGAGTQDAVLAAPQGPRRQ